MSTAAATTTTTITTATAGAAATGAGTAAPSIAGTAADTAVAEPSWRRRLAAVFGVYVFSRVCVMIGAAIVAAEVRADEHLRNAEYPWDEIADPHYPGWNLPSRAGKVILDVLTGWDGAWYMRIVREGYPRVVVDPVTYFVPDARAAFFPLYPMVVRVADRLLPGGDVFAALSVTAALGMLATLLVGVLTRRLFGDAAAHKAMIVFLLFPGSFVLSYAYTEALLIVLAAACLWCLLAERWVAAGVLAALGTATRPNGVALIAACAVAAFIAIRRRGDWSALCAALFAPLGFVVFQVWLGLHAGEPAVWLRVQRQAWDEGIGFGRRALSDTLSAIADPLASPTKVLTAASVAATIWLVWMAWKRRVPAALNAYSAVIIAMMLMPDTVTARPRFVLTAFPLFISAGAWFERDDRRGLWPYVLAASSVGLVAVTAIYGVYAAIP